MTIWQCMCSRAATGHLRWYWGMLMTAKSISGAWGAYWRSCGLRTCCFIISVWLGCWRACRVFWGRGRSGWSSRAPRSQNILARKILSFICRTTSIIFLFLRRPPSRIGFAHRMSCFCSLFRPCWRWTRIGDPPRNKLWLTPFCSDEAAVIKLQWWSCSGEAAVRKLPVIALYYYWTHVNRKSIDLIVNCLRYYKLRISL